MLPTPFARCVFSLCACVCIGTGPTSRHRHSQSSLPLSLSLSPSLSLLLFPSGMSHQQVDQLAQPGANPNKVFRLQFQFQFQFRYWLRFCFCFGFSFCLFLCICFCFWFLCGFAAFAGGIQKQISHVNKISRIINYPTVRTACAHCACPSQSHCAAQAEAEAEAAAVLGAELKNAASVQRHESSNKRVAAAGEWGRGGRERGETGGRSLQSPSQPNRTLLWPVNDTKIVCH